MAVKIRLNRIGTKNKPYYRVVVTDSRKARRGKYIEVVGWYNPRLEKDKFGFEKDKILDWIKKGAEISFIVRKLLGKAGILKALDLASLTKRSPKVKAGAAQPKEAEAAKKESTPQEKEKKEVPQEEKKEGEKKEEEKK